MLKFKEFETLASNQDNRGSLDTKNLLNDMLNVQMNQVHLYPLQMFQTPAATIGGGFGAKKNVKITNCIHTTARLSETLFQRNVQQLLPQLWKNNSSYGLSSSQQTQLCKKQV